MEQHTAQNLASRRTEERVRILLTCFLGAVLFFMSFAMTHHIITDMKNVDFQGHLRMANELTKTSVFRELATGNDRLWHVIVWLLLRLGMEGKYAACLVTAVTVTAAYGIYCGLFDRMLGRINRGLIPVASLALCLVQPIYLPWYSERIYRGQDSPNVWHNPTQLIARPLALLAFWLTVRIYRRLREGNWQGKTYESKQEAAVYTLLITFSVWAKPSYFQIAVPALGVLMIADLIRSRGRSLLPSLKVAAAYVPGALLTVMKFVDSFGADSGSGLEIAFFDVWAHSSKCIPVSILLLYAFPLFVLIVDRKRIFPSVEGQLSLAMVLVSGLMAAALAETGDARYHGNLTWGWGMASVMAWFVALRQFIDLMTGDELEERQYQRIAYVGWTLLALHLLTGIVYYCQLMTGKAQC